MSLSGDIQQRFARQIRLSQIGERGQEKLTNSSVLVIGAGGLGCPALSYLAAAGIGKIGAMDFDTVELSNLHRQLLFDHRDIGKPKAEAAAQKLRFLAPHSEIIPIHKELNNQIALEYFPDFDIILDATDQVHIRYLINDACRLLKKPWVFGAVEGFNGQWALFNHDSEAADYRDVFPIPQNPMTMSNCELNGIIGVVPGQVGVAQATECIKWICSLVSLTSTKLNTADYLNNSMFSAEIVHEKGREILDETTFLNCNYLNYVMGFHYKKEEM